MSIPWQNEVSKMALVTVTSKLKKKQNKPPTNVFWTHYLLDACDHGLFPLTYKFFFPSSSSPKYFSNMEENSETKYIKHPIAPWLGWGLGVPLPHPSWNFDQPDIVQVTLERKSHFCSGRWLPVMSQWMVPHAYSQPWVDSRRWRRRWWWWWWIKRTSIWRETGWWVWGGELEGVSCQKYCINV